MSDVRLRPCVVEGRVRAPPSKSYTHRALVVAHLSGHRFEIEGPLDADDTRRTAVGLRSLGSAVRLRRGRWTVTPAQRPPRSTTTIDCGESGTTLRFLVAVAARGTSPVRFVGRGRLGRRPMAGLIEGLRVLGASVERPRTGGPLRVTGPLRPGVVRLDASVSSQFASALLLVLPTLSGPSTVTTVGAVVSAPYLEATVAVLASQGIRLERRRRTFRIPAPQTVRGRRFLVPGDASAAAYLWAAAAVTGGTVRVDGIVRRWPQADLAVLPLLRRYGSIVRIRGASIVVRGVERKPFAVDLTDAPDLYPLAGTLAAVADGRSRLEGAAHVVHKESDRRALTSRLAAALGARVRSAPGALLVDGTSAPRALTLTGLSDHRVLMSAAVGALAADGPSRLGPAAAVGKSFPAFWSTLRRLGAEVRPL